MPGYKLLAPNPIHKSLRCPQRMLWIVILCQAIPTLKSEPSICTEALILQNLTHVSNLTWKKAHYHSCSLFKTEKQHSGTDLTKSHIYSSFHSTTEIYFLHLLSIFYPGVKPSERWMRTWCIINCITESSPTWLGSVVLWVAGCYQVFATGSSLVASRRGVNYSSAFPFFCTDA